MLILNKQHRDYSWGLSVFYLGTLILLAFYSSVLFAREYSSTVNALDPVRLSIPFSGYVKSINTYVGKPVVRQEVLVEIDDRELLEDVNESEAKLKVAEIEEKSATKEYQRIKALYDSQVWSTSVLDSAEAKYYRAISETNAAKAAFNKAKLRYNHRRIVAPYDGVVSQIYFKPFELVNNANVDHPIIELTRHDQLEVMITLTKEDYRYVSNRYIPMVRIDGNQYPGDISAIQKPANSDTTFGVSIVFSVNTNLVGKTATVSFKAVDH